MTMGKSSPSPDVYQSLHNPEDCVAESRKQPVLLLKHSATCPISANAKHEVDAFLTNSPLPAYLVVVQNARLLSNFIAAFFQIPHESPQLLFIRDGAAKRVLNHFQITVENITQTLASLQPAAEH